MKTESGRKRDILRRAFPFWQCVGLMFVAFGLAALFAFPRADSGVIYDMAKMGSNLVNTLFLTLGSVTLLFIAWHRRSQAIFIRSVGAMLGETIVVHLIKGIDTWAFHWFPRPTGGSGGFPSGHASAACTMAYLLTDHYPKFAPLWYGIAAWIAWSRRDTRGHYEYQIIGGVIVGLMVAVYFVLRLPLNPAHTAPGEAKGISES